MLSYYDSTQITVIIAELSAARSCVAVPANGVNVVGGFGLYYGVITAATWLNSTATLICQVSTTMPSTSGLISTITTVGIPATTSDPQTTTTIDQLMSTAATATTTLSPQPTIIPPPSTPFYQSIPILAGMAGGAGVILLVLAIVGPIIRRNRLIYLQNKKLFSSATLEYNGAKKHRHVYISNDTMASEEMMADGVARNADFDELFGAKPRCQSCTTHQSSCSTCQSKKEITINDLKGGRVMSQDCTLLNTKVAIALPGFLKLDYHSDLRPLSIIAEGGGGIIYQSELLDDRLRSKYDVTQCAVKLLKNPGNWSDEEMMRNFKQEVAVMWSLGFNENIIKLIGYTGTVSLPLLYHWVKVLDFCIFHCHNNLILLDLLHERSITIFEVLLGKIWWLIRLFHTLIVSLDFCSFVRLELLLSP